MFQQQTVSTQIQLKEEIKDCDTASIQATKTDLGPLWNPEGDAG